MLLRVGKQILAVPSSNRMQQSYKLLVAYDGTRFHGMQRQIDNAAMNARQAQVAALRPKKRPFYEASGRRKHCCLSVQEVFEMLILDLYPTTNVDDVCMRFAGRTDKGVHANGQVVVVNLPSPDDDDDALSSSSANGQTTTSSIESKCFELRNAINSRLPIDISVQSVEPVEPSFNPRQNVLRKQYSYTIKYRRRSKQASSSSSSSSSGPHTIRHAMDPPCLWNCPWALDDSGIAAMMLQLQGTHDYSNFVHKADRTSKDQKISVDRASFEIQTIVPEKFNGTEAPVVTAQFVFDAAGFRRTMLRNLVGYVVDVCRGAAWAPAIEDVFVVFDDNGTIATNIHAAPAEGLCLESVTYR